MFRKPPLGKVEIRECGSVGVLIWEPGTGAKYTMLVADLSDEIASIVGGSMMVSLMSMEDNTFISHAVNPNMMGHWARDYVRRKWQRIYGIGDHVDHLTMLLNWALGGDRAQRYADELLERWNQVHEEKVVRIGSVRRRSRSDS